MTFRSPSKKAVIRHNQKNVMSTGTQVSTYVLHRKPSWAVDKNRYVIKYVVAVTSSSAAMIAYIYYRAARAAKF